MRSFIYTIIMGAVLVISPNAKSAAGDVFDDVTALVQQGKLLDPGLASVEMEYQGILIKSGGKARILTRKYDPESGRCIKVTLPDGAGCVAKEPKHIEIEGETLFTVYDLYQMDGVTETSMSGFPGLDIEFKASSSRLVSYEVESIYQWKWSFVSDEGEDKWFDYYVQAVPYLSTAAWWSASLVSQVQIGGAENLLWGISIGLSTFCLTTVYTELKKYCAFEKLKYYWLQNTDFIHAVLSAGE